MAPASLAELRALKRVDLQALCKENDVKANGKTDVLIASLADKLGLAVHAAPAPVAATLPRKAPATASSSKTKKTPASTPSQAGQLAPSASTASSPSTQDSTLAASLADLAATVNDLQTQLAGANAKIAKLEKTTLMQLSPAYIDGQVEDKISELLEKHEAAYAAMLEPRDNRLSILTERIMQQDHRIAMLERPSSPPGPAGETWEVLEAELDTLRCNVMSRIDRLEARLTPQPAAQPPAASHPTMVTEHRSRAVSFASPSLSDAPPTQSLVSFDTPTGSPAGPAQDSPFVRRLSIGSRKVTPFKLGSTVGAGEDSPAPALPSHMLAVAASAARRSQRPGSVGVSGASAPAEPERPAAPAPNAALGKHARYSDASDASIVLAAVGSPEQSRAATPFGNEGFFTAPNSVKKAPLRAEASAKKDAHARKKVRVSSGAMSTGTIIDHGEETEGDLTEEDDQDEPVDSFARDEPQQVVAVHDAHAIEDDTDDDEQNDVRDYLVATKSGDSPATAPKPAAASLSIHDPTFFALPVSPSARSTPARRAFTFANENAPAPAPVSPAPASATKGRKSLPLAALPFPLVSPFRAAPSPTAAASKSARKTPAGAAPASGAKATMRTFFANASNRSSGAGLFTAAATASASDSKSRSHAGTLSGSGGAGAPPTPLAPRTLFGTEDAGEGRFGEGEAESPAKGWTWERGAFAGAF